MKRIFFALLTLAACSVAQAASLELKRGDHISFIGNTLAERMQHHGWLEARLQSRFPQHELSFRNLGFSGDELTLRLRSANFGTPDEWLTKTKTDVVFAFFGYNESYGDEAGLPKFKQDLDAFVKGTLAQKYNGTSAPRLVLFSPISHENLHDRNLSDGKENNRRIALYTAAMAEVAKANEVVFVDLFHPTLKIYEAAKQPLTINGVHLNEHGDELLSAAVEQALFPAGPAIKRDAKQLEQLRQAVLDKNFFWFERYRTVDGYSIYGGRADLKFVDGQTNREVMQREMEVLDVMTANRDQRVWAVAQGKDLKVDDSNTPPFIPVKTNKPGPGPNGTHLFMTGEQDVAAMTLAPGLKANLFASEEMFPELANPVQMAFDTKGRMWVATMPSYPHWKPKEEMNDMVLILEDTDGDGKADKRTVFADKLHVPTGLEFYNGGLLIGQQPDLVYLKDTNGDDVADYRERVINGLDSADTHHAENSFTLDPGGALYFQEGTFHHTQVETPYGPPERCANAGVFRYEPRTQKFEVYVTYGFANPHGHIFDRWGQDLVTDGTGSQTYYATAFSGRLDFPNKHPGMQTVYKQWTRPCPGTEVLSSRHFPDEMQGNLLVGNVIGFQGILQYKMNEKDSGFEGVEAERLVQSSDLNFRPTDIEIGPDGAIYFTEWQNPIIGHMQHNLRDPSRDRTHGRVYRLTYEGRALLKPAKIAGEPIDTLLDLLKEPEDRVRYRAKIELGGRNSDEVIAALGKWIARLDKNDANYQHHLLEALWVHQYHNVVDEKLLAKMLRSPDYHARAAATRVLCYWRDRVADPLALLRVQADDDYPRVRLEAVRACSFFRDAKAAEVALLALKHPMDYYLSYTLTETMRQLDPYWKKAVQEGGTFAADNPAGVDYLLKNVSTAELVKLPRTPLVYQALLSRPNIGHEYRQEAVTALTKLNNTNAATELLAAMERLDRDSGEHGEHVLQDLAHLLAGQPADDLHQLQDRIAKLASDAKRPFTREIAYVALATADNSLDRVWQSASKSARTLSDLLNAIAVIPDAKLRATAYSKVEPLLHKLPEDLAAQLKNQGGTVGRYVRIELPGDRRTLTLAEVQVYSDGANIAPQGKASQSTTSHGGDAKKAIDGNASSAYGDGGQTHTEENKKNPWWELDLGGDRPIDSIVVFNRADGGLGKRLDGFRLVVKDAHGKAVFEKDGNPAPDAQAKFALEGDPAGGIRRAAISAIASIPGHETETFNTLAGFIEQGDERDASIRALRRIPKRLWPKGQAQPLLASIMAYVTGLSTEERTEPAALDALQLGGELASLLPVPEAKKAKAQLSELGVNVILVRTVPHKMIYDRPKLYVEAGKPVVIVLENADIMPHNLLIGAPGSLTEIGLAAEAIATSPDAIARNFIPDNKKVLFATRMVQPRETARLQFTAPKELGEYPYLCTFPGHWRIMRGVMHVVPKLADISPEELNPPIDVVAESRPFVRKWTVEDLAGELGHLNHARSFENGKAMFTAATCVKCHKLAGQGGAVGPDLSELAKKLADKKHTPASVLTEMIEPSKVIDPKFRAVTIQTEQGEVLSGLITSENAHTVRIVAGPDTPPRDVPVEDIEERVESKISMMPEGLLVTLTKEDILDLMAYIMSGGDAKNKAFVGGKKPAAAGGHEHHH